MVPCLADRILASLSLLALFLDAPDGITLAGRVEYGAEGRMTDGYEGSPRGACTTLYLSLVALWGYGALVAHVQAYLTRNIAGARRAASRCFVCRK